MTTILGRSSVASVSGVFEDCTVLAAKLSTAKKGTSLMANLGDAQICVQW
jgi:hypothetical protein